MLEKLKNNIKKFFGSNEKDKKINEVITHIEGNKPTSIIVDEYRSSEVKKIDSDLQLKKKLQLIAKNTKKFRIRKKNIRRLVNLYGEY